MRKLLPVLLAVIALAALWAIPGAASSSSPPCTRAIARQAVASSPLGPKMLRLIGQPATNSSSWGISTFHCRNLTGETDMVVKFGCCTADSPTPLAIFRPSGGQWQLSYYYRGVPPTYGLSVKGGTLIEHRPVYTTGPLCCPNYYRYWSLRWNGYRWILKLLPGRFRS